MSISRAISRDDAIATLDRFAGPLGPMTSPEEQLDQQARWVADGSAELLEILVGLVASPPAEDQVRHASLDDWTTVLVEVTGALGRRHRDVAVPRLLPLLDDERARGTAIAILGGVGDARAVAPLGQLIRGRRLGEDDLVRVACALGEIGGAEACQLLGQLQQSVAPDQGELRQEIEIAVQAAGCE
jgi:HEAT repeat protein